VFGCIQRSSLSHKQLKLSKHLRPKACFNMAEAGVPNVAHQGSDPKPQLPHSSTELSSESGSAEDTRTARQKLSDLFTIFASGAALISDGYQNNLMTMTNVALRKEYPKQYTSY